MMKSLSLKFLLIIVLGLLAARLIMSSSSSSSNNSKHPNQVFEKYLVMNSPQPLPLPKVESSALSPYQTAFGFR